MQENTIYTYSLTNQLVKAESYLKNGGDVDVVGEYDSSALHYACREGNIEMIELLLRYNADVNKKNKYSTIYPLFDILSSTKIKNPLPFIQLLLENGADITTIDSFGNSILHYAVEQENMDLVKLSIQSGCDINSTERHDKDTPLHYACFQKNREIIHYLVEQGADRKRLNIYSKMPENYL
jgi:ankyrin repeat protein